MDVTLQHSLRKSSPECLLLAVGILYPGVAVQHFQTFPPFIMFLSSFHRPPFLTEIGSMGIPQSRYATGITFSPFTYHTSPQQLSMKDGQERAKALMFHHPYTLNRITPELVFNSGSPEPLHEFKFKPPQNGSHQLLIPWQLTNSSTQWILNEKNFRY